METTIFYFFLYHAEISALKSDYLLSYESWRKYSLLFFLFACAGILQNQDSKQTELANRNPVYLFLFPR